MSRIGHKPIDRVETARLAGLRRLAFAVALVGAVGFLVVASLL